MNPPSEPLAAEAQSAFARSVADAPTVDRGGYRYIIHPMLDGVPRARPEELADLAAWAKERPLLRHATLLVAPEAMAIPLAVAVSLATGIPYTVARKRRYGLPGELDVPVRTGYGASTLHVCDVRPEDRVVVLDTLASTGATLDGLLRRLRPHCSVLGAIVLFDKGGICPRIAAEHGVPIEVLHAP